MLEIEPRKIVVGISHTQDHDAVLEYAAVEAARHGCGVHVVLVEHPVWSNTQDVVATEVVGEDLRRADAQLLLHAEQRVGAWLPEDAVVSTELTHGAVARALCEIAEHSEQVALQHHRQGRMFHLPTLSVTNAVASRAPVPVVAVPDDWHEAEVEHRRVVAGIERTQYAGVVAEAAFREAEQLGAELRLMHVWSWSDDDVEDDPIVKIVDRHERNVLLHDWLQKEIEPVAARHPAVAWEPVATYGDAAYALIVQSQKARRLVLGRHAPSWRFGSHLGPVTRTVLTYAHCPVMVVDPRPAEADGSSTTSDSTLAATGSARS